MTVPSVAIMVLDGEEMNGLACQELFLCYLN